MMRERIDRLRAIADKLIDANRQVLIDLELPLECRRELIEDFAIKKKFLNNLLGEN